MASFVVTNSKYPQNPKKFTVSIDRIGKVSGEPGTKFRKKGSDDQFWEIHIAVANAYTEGGVNVGTLWRDLVTNDLDTVEKLIVDAVNELSSRIDWSEGGTYEEKEDTSPPFVTSTIPLPGETNVDIHQRVIVTLEDFLPAKGIDLSTVKLFVDDVQVVPDKVEGNPFKYMIYYRIPRVEEEIEDT